jgi:aryl-alcohol dehydrogenase-like predicted oxidoreductase
LHRRHASLGSILSGKYRSSGDFGKSERGKGVAKYLDERGLNILKALDTVAAGHQAGPAEIALAWLMAREGVTAPIASATSVAQVESFGKAAALSLTADDLAVLDSASL